MHSISSAQHVENYVSSLSKCSISDKGATCTEPVSVQINRARVWNSYLEKTQYYFSHYPRLAQKTCRLNIESNPGILYRGFERALVAIIIMGDELVKL